jgi:hypothetical protein
VAHPSHTQYPREEDDGDGQHGYLGGGARGDSAAPAVARGGLAARHISGQAPARLPAAITS